MYKRQPIVVDTGSSNTTRKNHKPIEPVEMDYTTAESVPQGEIEYTGTWNLIQNDSFVPSRECDATSIVNLILISIFKEYGEQVKISQNYKIVAGQVDFGVINSAGIITGCCEVKPPQAYRPTPGFSFHSNVYGQTFDYMKEIAASTYVHTVFAIVTDYLHWKVMEIKIDKQDEESEELFTLPNKHTFTTPETSAKSNSSGGSPPGTPFDIAIAGLFPDGYHEIKKAGDTWGVDDSLVDNDLVAECFVSKQTWLCTDPTGLWRMLKALQ